MILLFPTLIDFENPEDRKNFDITYVDLLHNLWTVANLVL